MENEKKEFTGIWIPVEVLDLDSVTGNEMLLLSYIIGLSNNERGCYATNRHLAERLGLSKGRISEMVSSLFNKGLITYQVFQDKGNERAIFPDLDTYKEKQLYPIMKNGYTYNEKTVNPIPEKAEHNRKVYNKEERKEERELSHFDFLNNKYPDKIKELSTKNNVSNWSNLIRKFNLKSFKNEPSLKDLENYIISWLENEKPNNNKEPSILGLPAYRRIIN